VSARFRVPAAGAKRDERGSVLILVIAILVAVGMLVAALASLATPIFAQAKVTRDLNDTGAAIDAGIQYGIQSLQASFSSNPGMCQPPPNPAPVVNPPTVNNYGPPRVKCATVPPSSTSLTSQWITEVVLTSHPPRGTNGRYSARAVVEVNNLTGATTILSWRTCQDQDPCP
jgi:hypothetical protein